MYDLSKTSRLPLQYAKGTVKQRSQLAEKLFKEFCTNIESEIKDGAISVSGIKDSFNKTVPSKIGIQISDIGKSFYEETGEYEGLTGFMIRGKNRKVSGFNIFIPLNKDKTNFHISNLDILLHEIRHVYDFITQPKTLSRGFFVPKKLQHFYDEKIYPCYINTNKLETRIYNKLKRLPYYKKIDFLQDCRGALKSEINACDAEKVYLNFSKKYPDKMPDDKIFNNGEFFEFREKLEIVNKLLRNELIKLRKENKELYGKPHVYDKI